MPEVRLEPVSGPWFVGQWIAVRATGAGHPVQLGGPLPAVAGLRMFAAQATPGPADGHLLLHASPTRPGVHRFPRIAVVIGTEPGRTRPLPLEIRPIPSAGRPAEFSGGVGPVTGTVRVAPESVRAGDWFELEVTWSGPGAVGMVSGMPLTGLPDGLEVRERDRREEFAADEPSRRFRWQLRADRPGVIALPPQRIATFDPISGRFFTRSTPGLRVTIEPRPQFRPGPEASATAEPPRFARVDRGRLLALSVIPLAGLLLVGSLVIRILRQRRRSPQRLARRLANRLDSQGADAPGERTASLVETALRQYLELATGRRIATLTPLEAHGVLLELGAGEELASSGSRLMERCDAARYGISVEAPLVDGRSESLSQAGARVLRGLTRLTVGSRGGGGRATKPAERSGTRRAF